MSEGAEGWWVTAVFSLWVGCWDPAQDESRGGRSQWWVQRQGPASSPSRPLTEQHKSELKDVADLTDGNGWCGRSCGSGAREDRQEEGQEINSHVVAMVDTKAALLQGPCTSHACQLHRMVASRLWAKGAKRLVLLLQEHQSPPVLLPWSAVAAQTRCVWVSPYQPWRRPCLQCPAAPPFSVLVLQHSTSVQARTPLQAKDLSFKQSTLITFWQRISGLSA